ncbi:GNAT family N-acetyltransferase [Natronosalvus vescus]|uniref:GNAT family N-acetyltransferase n=1 Tax=Natronosalvus vescus TaxID=2953881 RepID=UPI00209059B9|nr:GNAT family N-acetyltransferase [Natronosalvus vescus]
MSDGADSTPTETPTADGSYRLEPTAPTPDAFLALRKAAGMAPRSLEAVERGLPNSVFAVHVIHEPTGDIVGMGRIVGDDGAVYHISDMAVHPDHQGTGLGTRIMESLWAYIEETAPETAYVNLIADVDGFYERFGFEETRPASKGMYHRVE